jgi:hypothetical protein
MIPWLWIRTGDPAQIIYAITMSVIYWSSMIPEIREYLRLRREGHLEAFTEAEQMQVVGRRAGELVNEMSLSKLIRIITGKRGEKKPEMPES